MYMVKFVQLKDYFKHQNKQFKQKTHMEQTDTQ